MDTKSLGYEWAKDTEFTETTWYDLYVKGEVICAICNDGGYKDAENEWEVVTWLPNGGSHSCPPQIYADTLEEAQAIIEKLLIIWVLEGVVTI